MAQAEKKTCYIISPIGAPGSDIRRRSDTILNYIIKPVVMDLGYKEPVRSDLDQESDMITPAIIRHLLNDDLVIGDLTDRNPNVFYELGIRHLIQKPVIHMMQLGQTPPFDTQDIRAIPIDTDIEVATQAKQLLKERIEALEKDDKSFNSPVKVSITLEQARSLQESISGQDSTSQAVLANVSDLVENQSRELHRIGEAMQMLKIQQAQFTGQIQELQGLGGVGSIFAPPLRQGSIFVRNPRTWRHPSLTDNVTEGDPTKPPSLDK